MSHPELCLSFLKLVSVIEQKLRNLRNKIFIAVESLHGRVTSRRLLVLGDSHAAVFRHLYWRFAFPSCAFRTVSVGGATASGAENPNSTTMASAHYDAALKRQDFDAILVSLGEVDTGFLIWHRSQTKRVSVEDSYAKTIERYYSFLQKLMPYAPLCVLSTPLPTIGDVVEESWGEIANLRKEVKANQLQRTELTLRFNRDVESFCHKHGIAYISLDSESLGNDGLVKRDLMNRDSRDHHYQDVPYCRMIRQPLKKWLGGLVDS